MQYDFDKVIDRKRSGSYKWTANKEKFGRDDLLPFWVADMDFATPPPVIDAIRKRLEHPVFGYSVRRESYLRAIINWLSVRHNWDIKREWLTFCPPGVIQGINLLLNVLSEPGDEIILQTPAYKPLINLVSGNERILVRNELKFQDNRYTFDFEDLRNKITPATRLLILCSPHNPTGRVWSREELNELAGICLRNNIRIISDEIHADLVFNGHRHIPLGSLSDEIAMNSVTCFSAGKTFNISGLQQASLVIPNRQIRERFENIRDIAQINLENTLSEVAIEAAYSGCREWLDQLIAYLEGNAEYLASYLGQHLPEVNVIRPDGTFLVWINMKGLGMSSGEIKDLMVYKAGIALYEGKEFGEKSDGFFRMNIACPRSLLAEGLNRMVSVLQNGKV